MRDFYEILEVEKDATDSEIKKAYRKKAKKYHPDLNPGDEEAAESFKEATAAYEILSNPDMRSRYDRYGHAGVDPNTAAGGGGFGGFEDIFSDIFGDIFGGGFGGGQRERYNGPRQGADLRYDINIEFEEAVFGVEKEITVRKQENCKTCDGTGAKPGTEPERCSKCHGSGEMRTTVNTPFGPAVSVGACDVCNGTGEEIKEKCETCTGTGRVIKGKKLKVKVPAGVDNESIISIRGEGEAGEKGGPYGDLYVYIHVAEDEIFHRRGDDIFIDLPVTFTELALGAEIEVPTLDGLEKFSIPAGTQTGKRFKLSGEGVQNVRNPKVKGDLYFDVNVTIPKQLTDKQKELLREFAEESGQDYHEEKKGFFEKVKDVFC